MSRTLTALTAVLLTTSSASAYDTIALGARAPNPKILSLTGTDTADAIVLARLEKEEFEACATGDGQACATGDLEIGQQFTLKADCRTEIIIDDYGIRYVRDGSWGADDIFAGRPRFRDAKDELVSTANAYDGGKLAVNYEILCPMRSSLRKVGKETPRFESNYGVQSAVEVVDLDNVADNFVDHNGSIMRVDGSKGFIVYDTPKTSIRKSIKPGTVLFRGKPWNDEDPNSLIVGRARVFKAGCDAAEYEVRGHYRMGYVNTFTLEGTSPVRSKKSCAITGGTTNSPNAELLFEPHMGAEPG